MATYVMSDIHGQFKAYLKMLEQIGFNNFKEKDVIYVIGDVIDRGPGGIAILRHMMQHRSNIKFIVGNHEIMMVKSFETNDCSLWMYNGGAPTYDELMSLEPNIQENIIQFIKSAPYQAEISILGDRNFILVHGRPYEATVGGKQKLVGPFDNQHMYGMTKNEQIVWGKMHESYQIEGKTIVFGHFSTHHYAGAMPGHIYFGKNCIGIDCGCAYNRQWSNLGCLRLDDLQEFYEKADSHQKQR